MQPTRNIKSYPDTASRGLALMSHVPLSIALVSASLVSASLVSASLVSASLVATLSLSPATAQTAAPTQQATAVSPDDIKQREQELEAAREQQRKATELQQKLRADIAAIGQDRSKLNQQLIDIAAQVRGVETRIGDAEA